MSYVLTVTLNAAIDTTLTIPLLEAGASYTAIDVLKLPGGKGLNVARTLRGLEVPVWATGLAGGQPVDFILEGLDAAGIAPHFLRIAAPSRTCTAIVERDRHRVTEVNEPGPEIAPDEAQEFVRLFAELVGNARLVALSGSLPPGLPDDYYARLLARSRAAGVPAVLDTRGRGLGPGLEALPLLVKPNAKEAGTLLGMEVHGVDDALRAGHLLRAHGARMAAVTLGAAGAVLVTEMGSWWAHAEVRQPVSTVGCGDAFTGGFIAALCAAAQAGEGATIEEASRREDVAVRALILATACGAANALTLGAGLMKRDDVTRCRRAVLVKPLMG
jgi:1-phosphofructokinase family hexose kinase